MIPKNLLDYVKIYENHLPDSLCISAVENLKLAEWNTHTYYSYEENKEYSYDTDLDISHTNIPEKEEITRLVWHAIERYILKDFNFSWWDSWHGFTTVRFNKYDVSTEMRLHCDHIHSMFDGDIKGIPTLTVLGALNNNYKGGELFMFEDTEIHLPMGSVVLFPSNFMYPHKVNPVTEGVRYSYVSWVW